MRILLLGDVHGNESWFNRACIEAVKQGCDLILQLGDFGYWEHHASGVRYLSSVEKSLAKYQLTCYWIDGNHENHTLLREKYVNEGNRTSEGFYRIRENLYYIPRGARWTWDGVSFLGLGGAYSVDKVKNSFYGFRGRKEGSSWWPEEVITEAEAELAKQGGKVDVMVSHDCPWGVEIPGIIKDDFPESADNRKTLSDVVRAVRPNMLFCGHYHVRHSATLETPFQKTDDGPLGWHQTRIEILNRDGENGAGMVFDTNLSGEN